MQAGDTPRATPQMPRVHQIKGGNSTARIDGRPHSGGRKMTAKQAQCLRALGYEGPTDLTRLEASDTISVLERRRTLMRAGQDPAGGVQVASGRMESQREDVGTASEAKEVPQPSRSQALHRGITRTSEAQAEATR